jgi:hypothetical protein
MEQVIHLGAIFVSVLIGATIFALVSVLCGYSPFYDLTYPKALALCGTIGVFAFLLSDLPQMIISIGKAHPNEKWSLLEAVFAHFTTLTSYGRLAVNALALAFIISGFIGSDFLIDLRRLLSRKKAVRVPVSEWDALLWLYAKTGDAVTVHLKQSSNPITGTLDFRSIGREQQAIVLKRRQSQESDDDEYIYIPGSEISTIVLRTMDEFTGKEFRKNLRKNRHYVVLSLLGLITLIILPMKWALAIQILLLISFPFYLARQTS